MSGRSLTFEWRSGIMMRKLKSTLEKEDGILRDSQLQFQGEEEARDRAPLSACDEVNV